MSGTLFSDPSLTRSPTLVHQDGGYEASLVSVLYIGHKEEPKGLFVTSLGSTPISLVSVSASLNRCTCLEVLDRVTMTEKSNRL